MLTRFLRRLLLVLLAAAAGCSAPVAPPLREWTFLVYLAADNNLHDFAALDLREMQTVGSTAHLAIVVQYDPLTPGEPTRRLLITRGGASELASIGETNTGDESVLRDFLAWAAAQYPARRYALVLWNHGSGIYDRFPLGPPGAESGFRAQAVGIDWSSGNDALTTREYAGALRRASDQAGIRLSVLYFDACAMQMAEIAAELMDGDGRPLADYLVGSEANVPAAGADYAEILSWLAANSRADGAALATRIVDSFGRTYAGQDATLSALELAGASWLELLDAHTELASAIIAAEAEVRRRIAGLAAESRRFVDYLHPVNKDLGDFARLLAEMKTDPAVAGAAARVGDLLRPGRGPVIRVASTGALADGRTHGLAVFLPATEEQLADYPHYEELRFPALTGWGRAIAALHAAGS